MAPEPLYRDDLELGSLQDESSYEPDSPLPSPANLERLPRKPRWLSDRTSRWRILEQLEAFLRPRLTWKYVFFSILILYILYCFVRQSPLLASRLPSYRGQYEVGAIDLEIPLEKPRKISET